MKRPRDQSVAGRKPPGGSPPAAAGTATFRPQAAMIFALAASVRILNVFQIRRAPFFTMLMGDARGYDLWAQRIAGGDWMGTDVFYQAPLYPYFLGTLYTLAGRDLLIVRLVQALVGGAACALLGLAAARLFSKTAGVVAGVALAIYAPAIFFDGLVQKSVLDVFFVCLALWLTSRIITAAPPEARWSWLWLGGAMGGLALTRENALVLIAVLLVWAILVPAGTRTTRVATFVLGLTVVLLPVAIRNYAVGGGFYLTTSQFGPNFYIGNNPKSDGTYMSLRYGRGAPEYERQDATELAEHALGRKLTPSEVSSYWTDRALGFVTSQPGAWLRLVARKFRLLWNADEMLDTESQEAYAEWSAVIRFGSWFGHFGVLAPLAVLGACLAWADRRRLWVLYAMTLAYAASVILFYVFARYRFPLVPFLLLFTSAGAVRAARDLSISGRRPPATVIAVNLAALAGVAVFANWPILSRPLMLAITETNLAAAFQEDGQLDQAIGHYRRALAYRFDYAPAHNNLGTVLRAQGRVDEAIGSYQRALDAQPDYPDAHYNLANALLEQNKPSEAAAHFRVALAAIPGSAGTHNNLGIALAAEGRLEESIAEFRAALQADPGSAKTNRNLGKALSELGRAQEGIVYLRRAIEIDPTDQEAHYDLGSDLLEMNRLAEAVDEFEAALKLDPAWVAAHNNLGIALASLHRLDEAIAHFREALRIQPDFADAKRNLTLAQAPRRPR